MKQALQLKLGQQLALTPQLQQAIKLLQMTNIELCAFIAEELEQNPMLEGEDLTPPDAPYPEETSENDIENPSPENLSTFDPIDFDTSPSVELNTDSGLDVDYENIYTSNGLGDDQTLADMPNQYADQAFGEGSYLGSDPGPFSYNLEQTVSELPFLRDHLIEQLSLEVNM